MKNILLLASGLALATTASAQVYASDDFSYTGALTSNGWVAHSGAGNKVINSNGTFATLDFSSGSGEDVSLAWAPALTATDDVYASFTLNVPSGNPVNPDSSGSYCVHFKDAGFAFRARFGLLSPAAGGDYTVAVNSSSANLGAGAVWGSDLSFDTDYTIVISYDAATGESKLWVDPTDAASTSVSHTGSAGALIENISLRQSSDHTGFINIDKVVAGNDFADVLPVEAVLTSTFAANNGQSGNMFDVRPLVGPVTINELDVNLDSGTWDMEVWTVTGGGSHVGNEQNSAAWTLVAAIPGVVSNGPNVATPLGQQLNIAVPCGANTGIYVTSTNGTAINYTTGLGIPVGTVYTADANLEFLAGTGNAYPFGSSFGGTSSSRIWNGNIHYTTEPSQAGCVAAASKSTYGAGCYDQAASFYEVLTPTGMDLGGMTITGTATASGYDITTAPGAWTGPGAGASNLNLGDDNSVDSATVGGTLGIHVGSNGWVAIGGGNSNSFSPSVTTMLANPATGLYAWTDLQPNSGGGTNGDVFYEENGTVATVTFDGVDGWNTGDPNSIQFVYDTASGDFSITFDTVSSLNPEDWLVGYSVGGPSLDGGPTDLSAAAFSTPAADSPALALDSNAPALGGNWDLTASNLGGSPAAFFFFGDTAVDPGVDLTSIGAPGCFAYTNANLAAFSAVAAGGVATFSLAVPNDPALSGASLSVQATASTALNSLTIATSNGLLGTFGL